MRSYGQQENKNQMITSQIITHHGITKNAEHILAKSSVPRHATDQHIFPIREQCERVCYSRNSRAFNRRTIPESYVTLNPVTQFHNRYVTIDIVSLLALQIPLQNSTPLCYRYATVMLPLTLYLGHKSRTTNNLS